MARYFYVLFLCVCLSISQAHAGFALRWGDKWGNILADTPGLSEADPKIVTVLNTLAKQTGVQWEFEPSVYPTLGNGQIQFALSRPDCHREFFNLKTFRVPSNTSLRQQAKEFFINNPVFFDNPTELKPLDDVIDLMDVMPDYPYQVSLRIISHNLPVFNLPEQDGAEVYFGYVNKQFAVCRVSIRDSRPRINLPSFTPTFPTGQAITMAKDDAFKRFQQAIQPKKPLLLNGFFKPGLIELGIYQDKGTHFSLAYQLILSTKDFEGTARYYIDAQNGNILHSQGEFREKNYPRCGNFPKLKDKYQDDKIIENPIFDIYGQH